MKYRICLQVVVVLSGSMQPGFYRGDILFLYHSSSPIRTGDIVVFNLPHRTRAPGEEDIPIVHRAVQIYERDSGGHINILTKGDSHFSSRDLALPYANRTLIGAIGSVDIKRTASGAGRAQLTGIKAYILPRLAGTFGAKMLLKSLHLVNEEEPPFSSPGATAHAIGT